MMKTEHETAFSPSLVQDIVLLLQSNSPENALVKELASKAKHNYVAQHHKLSIFQLHCQNKYMDGKWKTHVYVDGKRKGVTFRTEEETYEYLYDFYKAQEEAPKTFQDVFLLLMDNKRRNNITEHSIYEDTRYFNRIHEKIRNKPITEVTEDELRDWLVEDFLPGDETSQSLKKVIQVLNQTFRYGQEKRICRENPANFILYTQYANKCVQSRRSKEEKSFTVEEENRLREYALKDTSNPHAVCMLISMETGMRAGELAYLKTSDITRDGFIHVHGQQVKENRRGDKPQSFHDVHYTKNERRNPKNGRYIPILFDCEEALTYADNLKGESAYILHHPDGRPIQKDSYSQYLRRVCKALHINISNNHAFRMGFNIKMIEIGISEVDRCYILGHSMETNRKNYSNSDERHRDSIKKQMRANFPRRNH